MIELGKTDPVDKKLIFIGNFEAPYSTENDLKWTFEKLGWEVMALQENAADWPFLTGLKADLLLYVHTHGWDNNLDAIVGMIAGAKSAGVKTASFHLDRYWGLNQADQREARIGTHPFWSTDVVFTADGGDHPWADRGINHHWLKPAVVERDCYLGTKRPEFEKEIIFVGSYGYHPEYPFRAELLDWLAKTYENRFTRFAGDTPRGTIRGKDLNDLYASAKVVVGDSCFAGSAPRYWSDRVAETTGRGGFLIHPAVEGFDHIGVPTYAAGDFGHLKEMIDHFLEDDKGRETNRILGHEWTKRHATYTNRVREMLEVLGIQ